MFVLFWFELVWKHCARNWIVEYSILKNGTQFVRKANFKYNHETKPLSRYMRLAIWPVIANRKHK